MSAEAENKAIIVQVGPGIDINSLKKGKVGQLIFKHEARLVVELLRSISAIPPHGKSTVSFKNDDLKEEFGEEVEYPFVQIGEDRYEIELDNNS